MILPLIILLKAFIQQINCSYSQIENRNLYGKTSIYIEIILTNSTLLIYLCHAGMNY